MKDCNQCGKCCLLYGGGGLTVVPSDIDRWETHRPDIAAFTRGNKIWMDPDTGEQLLACPWLEKLPNKDKYSCRIYFDRPEECKLYPVRIDDMIRDGCEMLQPKDLRDLKRAQQVLDVLMADSRPPHKYL